MARSRPPQSNPPMPTKRKIPPGNPAPYRHGSSPPLKGRLSDPLPPLPPLPPKSPPLSHAPLEYPPPSPPVPRRQVSTLSH